MSYTSYTCPYCGAVSHNFKDALNQYCARCHRYSIEDFRLARETMPCYILDEKHQLHRCGFETWAIWFSTHERHVAKTDTKFHYVSTVFIGLSGQLFETMIFEDRDEQWRYDTWDQAVAGHAAAVAYIQAIEDQATTDADKLIETLEKK